MDEIKKNSIHTVKITGMTHEGFGVGRINSFVIFIDGAITGETVEAKIIKLSSNYVVGKLIRILSPSPERQTPFCIVHKRCGGCTFQHMSYKSQLEFKTSLVKDNLERIGNLKEVKIHETLGMENPLNYRNKAQYPVASIDGQPVVGFYAKRTHHVVENTGCLIQNKVSEKAVSIVKEFISSKKISIYNETNGKGIVRHIVTRTGLKTDEVMVILVINAKDLPHKRALVDMLVSSVPGIKSIVLNINMKKTNTILDEKNVVIFGKGYITDYIGEFRFKISPLSFYQVNSVQAEVLYAKALEYAGLTGKETVFDLYCGIGTISLYLSRKAKKVYGVEVVKAAVIDAIENAKINGVDNVEFIEGKAEEMIPKMYKNGVRADVVIVDPPRKGCHEALLETLVDMQPGRIVYVSCNPSTLARDLKYLEENGYKTLEVQPVDMFPYTGHVESCVLITRDEK
ncbi:MAG: 23S rRNA (uracil(1939)-C(5))-methyltransferase RlmD [Acetivibrionales bacterium]